MFPWWQKTPSKLPWEQETALKNDKSKSALQVMTAKLEARKAREDAQKDIRSWLIVQSILPVTSQGHRGQEMWHSAPSSVAKKTEQSITTARIYRQGLPICSYLLFDLFVSLSLVKCVEGRQGQSKAAEGGDQEDEDICSLQQLCITKEMACEFWDGALAAKKHYCISLPTFYHQHFQIHSRGGRTEQRAL